MNRNRVSYLGGYYSKDIKNSNTLARSGLKQRLEEIVCDLMASFCIQGLLGNHTVLLPQSLHQAFLFTYLFLFR